MKFKKLLKILFIIISVVSLLLLILGFVTNLLSVVETDEVDDSRVAISVTGTSNDMYTYVMLQPTHPKGSNLSMFENGNTLIPKMMETDYEFISVYKENVYMIELTDLLPLEYENATEYFNDGGKINVTIFYNTTDGTRVVAKEIIINKCGNHIISELTTNGQELEVYTENFMKSYTSDLFNKFDNVVDKFKDDKNKDSDVSEYNEIMNLPYDVIKIPSLSDDVQEF